MDTFFSSPLLQALAAIWLATGFVKGTIIAQQIPAMMGWWVFYKTEDPDQAAAWTSDIGLLGRAIFLGLLTIALFSVLGPLFFVTSREKLRYFSPYGDPYIANLAATQLKIPTGVSPTQWETWDQYQERIGHDPKKVAEAIVLAQPKLPQSIERVLDNAKELHNMDRKDIDVKEDEEFRDR